MKISRKAKHQVIEAIDFSDELEDEKSFRQYIEYVLLRQRNFKTYADELGLYVVNFLDEAEAKSMGIPIAAVDVQSRIIYITKKVKDQIEKATNLKEKKHAEDILSLLLRHELLHSILRHQYRTTIYIAKKLGFADPIHLTREQYQEVLKIKRKPALLTGGSATLSNYAGDLDLSRNYLERDKELTEELGGLLLEEHPEWLNYSFEDLLAAVEAIEAKLEDRMTGNIYGTINPETGEFEVDHEEPAFFESTKEFAADDVDKIDLITPEEFKRLSDKFPTGCYWLKSEPTLMDEYVFYTSGKIFGKSSGYIEDNNCTVRYHVIPTFKVSHVSLYKELLDQYNGGTALLSFKCLGQDVWIEIVDGHIKTIVGKNPIFTSEYELTQSDTPFKETVLNERLQRWFREQKVKYK